MTRKPPELIKDGEHAANMLAGRFDISRSEALADTRMAILLLYGHQTDTHTIAVRIRATASMEFLRLAKVLGDSGWSPGYIASEIARWCRGAEFVPVPEPDEFFGRDDRYQERWSASYGVLAWNLAAGTCECWGQGFIDEYGGSGVDVFVSQPSEVQHDK